MGDIEKMIDELINKSSYYIKRNFRSLCPLVSRKLDRHETVDFGDGYEFSCWMELTCYMVCKIINDIVPQADIELVLDGNSSTVEFKMEDEEIRKCIAEVSPMVKDWRYNVQYKSA